MTPHLIWAAKTSVASLPTLTKKQKSLGYRVVAEHGLIYNVLVCLGLVDQIKMSSIYSRAYKITVPWNMPPVLIPFDTPCDFPGLKIPSEDHVCKSIEATIEGEKCEFFGIVRKSTNLPDGFGVFRTVYWSDWKQGGWVRCGQVKNGLY
jgi:hypothetical protein